MPRDHPRPSAVSDHLLQELVDRARRTETRVTRISTHLGVDAGGEKPQLDGSFLLVPNIKVSLEDILDALRGFNGPEVSLMCDGMELGTLVL
jgi:hypothetical protein